MQLRYPGSVIAALFAVSLGTAFGATEPGMATAAQSQAISFSIKEFRFSGNSRVSTEVLQRALETFVGDGKTLNDLLAAKSAVQRAYDAAGYQMVAIGLPAEIGLDGIVHITLREIVTGRVTVSGNQYSSEASIRGAVPALQEGSVLNFDDLSRQLFLANDSVSRKLALDFKPASGNSADIEVKTEEESPLRIGVSADNTGTDATGASRMRVHLYHHDLWDRGHVASFSYTTSPEEIGSVKQFGLSYQVPLVELGDTMSFIASYSNVNSGRVANAFDVSGQGTTVGAHYLRNLRRDALSRHTLDIGIDDKRFKDTVDFSGINLGVNVNELPLTVGYQYGAQQGQVSWGAGISYVRNIPGGNNNDDATYNASRAGAPAQWSLWRANASGSYQLTSGWLLSGLAEGQYTDDPLIAGEQFGLGGARSVRGLTERETSGDRGYRLSLEVYTPPVAKYHRFLGFVDTGRQSRLNVQPGEQAGEDVLTYGLGWRMGWKDKLTVSLDLGIVANGTPTSESNDSRLHFAALWWF